MSQPIPVQLELRIPLPSSLPYSESGLGGRGKYNIQKVRVRGGSTDDAHNKGPT